MGPRPDYEKDYGTPEIRGSGNTKRAQHVTGMMLPLPPAARDRSPLWKDFTRPGFERPFMHGVVGPQWGVPKADVTDGFDIIGSPMPKPDLSNRIISDYFPDHTYTGTSFDVPKRQDVIQSDLPTQTTRTFEETLDPKGKSKKPVQTVTGTIYHGTGSTDPNVVFGGKFIESNSKEIEERKKGKGKKKREEGGKGKKKNKKRESEEGKGKKKNKKRTSEEKKRKGKKH